MRPQAHNSERNKTLIEVSLIWYDGAMLAAFTIQDRARLWESALAATGACARLDARVNASPWRAAWLARAHIHGVARVAALSGVTITAAELFRGLVGLVEPQAWKHYDWRRLSLSLELVRSAERDRGAGDEVRSLMDQLTSRGGFLLDRGWLDELDEYRSAQSRLVVGPCNGPQPEQLVLALATALRAPLERPVVSAALEDAYYLTGVWPEAPWRGWLLAPYLPEALVKAGLTTTPLPCLIPLRRSMRYGTATLGDLAYSTLAELADQAAHGLDLLDRLESCAAAWARRLGPTTARSHLEQAAGLFLVLPALTRHQVAAALGVSPAGAGKILSRLIDAGIARPHHLSERRRFFVAEESLGDFKLVARQGRRRGFPLVAEHRPPALDELEAAMRAVDDLLDRSDGVDSEP